MKNLRVKVSISGLYVKQFRNWIMFSNTDSAMKISDVRKKNERIGSTLLKQPTFACMTDSILQEVHTDQGRYVLRASHVVVTHAEKDSRVRRFFYTLFCARKISCRWSTRTSFCRQLSTMQVGALLLQLTAQSYPFWSSKCFCTVSQS